MLVDVETVLNVHAAGMLPRLAALGADIIIARPLYNRLRLGSVSDLIDSFTPPIQLIGPDERNWRLCWELVPVVISTFMLGAGRKRMERGEAGVLIVPQGHEWYSPRRLGNLRTLLVDEHLDIHVQRHFEEVAAGLDMEAVFAILRKVPDVPPDPGDEID
ncbi:hypothetical protein [Bosea vestrisii]|uniref:Uncharacterized protein n=1 Tax=Bosea vestrisii TaxID=151416 RepID=A0ABW0HD04_9HYPH